MLRVWAAIRDGMSLEEVKAIFRKNSLFFQSPVPAPMPAPEIYNGEWWNRYDVRISFNEGVCVEIKNAVTSIEIVPITTFSADKSLTKKKNTGRGDFSG